MRLEQVKVYEFSELSEEIRENVIENWRNDETFFWGDEWVESLETFSDWFGITIKNYSAGEYGRNHVNFSFEYDEGSYFYDFKNSYVRSDTQGIRLFKMLFNQYSIDSLLNNDCYLTGYIADEKLLEPIREFIKKPKTNKTFYELIDDCFWIWLNGFQADYDYWLSEESIIQDIESNEYSFLVNGEIY